MKKLKAIAAILAIIAQMGFLVNPPFVSAANLNCGNFSTNIDDPVYLEGYLQGKSVPAVVSGPFNQDFQYQLRVGGAQTDWFTPSGGTIPFDLWISDAIGGKRTITMYRKDADGGNLQRVDSFGSCIVQIEVGDPTYNSCTIDIDPNPTILGQSVTVSVSGLEPNAVHKIKFDYIGGGNEGEPSVTANGSGQASTTFTPNSAGDARIIVSKSQGGSNELCREQFQIAESEEEAEIISGESQELRKLTVNICTHIPDADKRAKCEQCSDGVWTGLGCFNTSPGAPISNFMKQLFSVAIGLGGGFSFLLLIYGAFMLTTSAGDPKAVENAKGIITGAITGLLVIIFSAVILQIIGVSILQIPKF